MISLQTNAVHYSTSTDIFFIQHTKEFSVEYNNNKIPPFFSIHWVNHIFIYNMYQFHYNWNINQGKGETWMEILFQHHAHSGARGVWSVNSETAREGLSVWKLLVVGYIKERDGKTIYKNKNQTKYLPLAPYIV